MSAEAFLPSCEVDGGFFRVEAEVVEVSKDALTCQLVNGAVLTARSLHEITKGQKGWVSIRPA